MSDVSRERKELPGRLSSLGSLPYLLSLARLAANSAIGVGPDIDYRFAPLAKRNGFTPDYPPGIYPVVTSVFFAPGTVASHKSPTSIITKIILSGRRLKITSA